MANNQYSPLGLGFWQINPEKSCQERAKKGVKKALQPRKTEP
jgi:hypothetical protein